MASHTTNRDNAIKLYLARPASIKTAVIAKELGVSVQWLYQLSKGQIENPGANTIEHLTAYLIEEKAKANV